MHICKISNWKCVKLIYFCLCQFWWRIQENNCCSLCTFFIVNISNIFFIFPFHSKLVVILNNCWNCQRSCCKQHSAFTVKQVRKVVVDGCILYPSCWKCSRHICICSCNCVYRVECRIIICFCCKVAWCNNCRSTWSTFSTSKEVCCCDACSVNWTNKTTYICNTGCTVVNINVTCTNWKCCCVWKIASKTTNWIALWKNLHIPFCNCLVIVICDSITVFDFCESCTSNKTTYIFFTCDKDSIFVLYIIIVFCTWIWDVCNLCVITCDCTNCTTNIFISIYTCTRIRISYSDTFVCIICNKVCCIVCRTNNTTDIVYCRCINFALNCTIFNNAFVVTNNSTNCCCHCKCRNINFKCDWTVKTSVSIRNDWFLSRFCNTTNNLCINACAFTSNTTNVRELVGHNLQWDCTWNTSV